MNKYGNLLIINASKEYTKTVSVILETSLSLKLFPKKVL